RKTSAAAPVAGDAGAVQHGRVGRDSPVRQGRQRGGATPPAHREGGRVVMIPPPPLDKDGALTATRAVLMEQQQSAVLLPCCACQRGSVWHWPDSDGVRHPLHRGEHCVDRIITEWAAMVASGETARVTAAEEPTGAYGRRAPAAGGAGAPCTL